MSHNENKDRPNVAASERPTETNTHGDEKFVPGSDFIMFRAGEQAGAVEKLLLPSRENAVTAATLAAALAFTDTRQVTKLVERERRAGAPICGSGHGYYLAADIGEW